MTTSLEGRLLRFLAREEEDEQRSFRDLRALPVNQRVLDGECIRTAVFEAAEADGFVFRVDENLSKFRAGDALAVGDGLEFETAASLCFGRYDAERGRLVLERDRFSRGEDVRFHVGETY
ncbi:MAG: hypothetical protein KDB80_05555, partial [Planctomycetes bacterium]|nr:hypothetical protein [Planctomycetota bacterium]